MMDQHDAAQALAAEIGQQLLGPAICASPSVPVANNGGFGTPLDRPTSATAVAPAQGREDVEARSPAAGRRPRCRRPTGRGSRPRRGDIDVVVAGNDGDVVRACRSAASHWAARLNSVGSEMFTRSPVSAMWSGFCGLDVGHDAGQRLGHVQMHAMRHQLK